MPSSNKGKGGQQRGNRRTKRPGRPSIGDDVSHHRIAAPSGASGISVAEEQEQEGQSSALHGRDGGSGGGGGSGSNVPVATTESAAAAAAYARQTARSIGRHSTNFDPRKEIAVPRFVPREVVLGTKLGRGGFSNVYEIVRFELRQQQEGQKQVKAGQRPNILGENDDEIVGVPVGGAVADSRRALLGQRRRRRSSQNSSGGGKDTDLEGGDDGDGGDRREEEKRGNASDNGNGHNDLNNDNDDDDDEDDASESSSDDDIPMEQLNRICRRVSNTSFGSAADVLSNVSNDGSDDDDGEVVHPILQRGQSTSCFASYHATAREFLARHCIRDAKSKNDPDTPRYALKRLRPDVMEDADTYRMGAADLVVEARFLACLEHPNVVKIRGMTHGDCEAFASGLEGGYFLVLDRLSETLTQRIERWRKETKLIKGKLSGNLFDQRGKKWNDHLAQRIEVGFELANALKYLHSKNIIFRDLKPDNVGFDCRGDCKLFDFGLAKELRDDERVDDPDAPTTAVRNGRTRRRGKMFTDVYEMSAPCGSYRYMAPEVIQAKPYNFSADAYSFAMLLYEISVMKKPYANMGREELIEKVAVQKFRPELPTEGRTALPKSLRTYLNLGWSANLRYRPSMEGTCGTLFKLLETLKETGIDEGKRPSAYDRRRSTFVMRGTSLRNLGLATGGGGSSRAIKGIGKIGSNRNLFKQRNSGLDST